MEPTVIASNIFEFGDSILSKTTEYSCWMVKIQKLINEFTCSLQNWKNTLCKVKNQSILYTWNKCQWTVKHPLATELMTSSAFWEGLGKNANTL